MFHNYWCWGCGRLRRDACGVDPNIKKHVKARTWSTIHSLSLFPRSLPSTIIYLYLITTLFPPLLITQSSLFLVLFELTKTFQWKKNNHENRWTPSSYDLNWRSKTLTFKMNFHSKYLSNKIMFETKYLQNYKLNINK